MCGWSPRSLKWLPGLLLTPLLIAVSAREPTARAGLLKPLIQLVSECRQLAEQALEGYASALVPEGLLKSTVEQPCQRLARPVSECLIRETSRSGRELGVLTELLGSRIGDDASVVIRRCLASLTGLPNSSLETLPVQELMERLRR